MITPVLSTRLSGCSTLPSLPGVALRIIELGRDPESDPVEVARTIGMDPALSAKLLRIANSPIYAVRRKVDNLRQALMLMGLNATLTLALSFSLVGALRGEKRESMDHALYWRRSLLAALAARSMGEVLDLRMQEELFLGGLLQDIGMLVLDTALHDEYAPAAALAARHDELITGEREILQTDHAEVGAWLMERWELAEHLRDAVRLSHEVALPPGNDGEADSFRRCVALSGRIADIWLQNDGEAASRETAAAAESLLSMDRATLGQVLERVSAAVPETASLFEMDLVEQHHLAAMMEQAREVLMIRNLKVIEEVTRARQQADQLETRARTLEQRSRIDALTGVYNRAHLDEVIRKEFDAATEEGWPLTVAFLDLDHFKSVNDAWGHQVGDEALRSVARMLSSHLRGTDVVARYGGEEFMVILPGTRLEGARVVLDRLRQTVAAEPLTRVAGEAVYVSVSIGVATHMDGGRFATLEELIRSADRAVYSAKRSGRNRLVVYGEEAA